MASGDPVTVSSTAPQKQLPVWFIFGFLGQIRFYQAALRRALSFVRLLPLANHRDQIMLLARIRRKLFAAHRRDPDRKFSRIFPAQSGSEFRFAMPWRAM
jgi:hypothetical protein